MTEDGGTALNRSTRLSTRVKFFNRPPDIALRLKVVYFVAVCLVLVYGFETSSLHADDVHRSKIFGHQCGVS